MKKLSDLRQIAYILKNRDFDTNLFVGVRFESYGLSGSIISVRVSVKQEARMMNRKFASTVFGAERLVTGILFGVCFDNELTGEYYKLRFNLSSFPHSAPITSRVGDQRLAIISWPYLIDLSDEQIATLRDSPMKKVGIKPVVPPVKIPRRFRSKFAHRSARSGNGIVFDYEDEEPSAKDSVEDYDDWVSHYQNNPDD